MISARELTREFVSGDETVVAVDDVSLTLDEGVFVAIVGPSGSGKSTLLSVLGTLDKPTAGVLEIDGRDVTVLSERELTAYRRSRIGFVFQSYNLIPNLSALDNVMLPMEFAGVPTHERRERARELLQRVGLSTDKHARKPGRLSGGEQQRVAIARALANNPCLILADEPTGNLDSETGALIIELLHDLARSEKTTVVTVTHDLEMAARADQTFRLDDGRIAQLDEFSGAVARAGAAYADWLHHRDAQRVDAFAAALTALFAAAPKERRLSAEKVAARYAEIASEPKIAAVLRSISTGASADDLFEDAE